MGEGELDFKFLPAGAQFHLRGSDEALTPYGGLVAWDHFLERCGVIQRGARATRRNQTQRLELRAPRDRGAHAQTHSKEAMRKSIPFLSLWRAFSSPGT